MAHGVALRRLLVGVLGAAAGARSQQDLYYIDAARQVCGASASTVVSVETPTSSQARQKIHVPAFFRTANHTVYLRYSLQDAAGVIVAPSNDVVLPAHASRRLSDGGGPEIASKAAGPAALAAESMWDADAMLTMCEDFFLTEGREPIELPETWAEARDAFRGICEAVESATCQADELALFAGYPVDEESFTPSDRFCAGLVDYYMSRRGVVALSARRLKGSASGGAGYRGTSGQSAVGGWDSKTRGEMASYGYTTSRMGSAYPSGYSSTGFGYSGRSITPARAATVAVVGAGALGGYGLWRWSRSTGGSAPSSCSSSDCTYDLSGQGLIRDDMMQYGFKPAEMRYPLKLTIEDVSMDRSEKEAMCDPLASENESEYGDVAAWDLFFGVAEVDELEKEVDMDGSQHGSYALGVSVFLSVLLAPAVH